jgi:hypothetical protein
MSGRTVYVMRAAAVGAGEFRGASVHGAPAAASAGGSLAAAALAMASGLLEGQPAEARDGMGLVLGTATACLHADRAFDRSRREAAGRYASPAAFAQTLPSTVAADLSVKLGLRGPLLTVDGGERSAAVAIRRGASWMRQLGLGQCLVGALEAGIGEVARPRGFLLLVSADPASGRPLPPGMVEASLDQWIAWVCAVFPPG